MPYFAKVLDGVVLQVNITHDGFFDTFKDTSPGDWIETDPNTRGNVHYDPITNQPDNGTPLRGNFANTGNIYDKKNDVFYQKPLFASWVLNTNTWTYEAPTPYPTDGNLYDWEETTKQWVQVNG